jgi:hypothetical protein
MVHDFINRRAPAAIESDDLREIPFGQPEVANVTRLDGEEHDAVRHSLHFAKP